MLVVLQRVPLRGIWCQAGEQTMPARSEPLSPKVKPTDTQWWQSGDSVREAHLAHMRHYHPTLHCFG